MRSGDVFFKNTFAGKIDEIDSGYRFQYDNSYLTNQNSEPVSLTLPLTPQPYLSEHLFPFFDGLIPEGWLLNLTIKNWKLRTNDRFGILIESCQDTIGAVSIRKVKNNDKH